MDLLDSIENIELKIKQLALQVKHLRMENGQLHKQKEALEAALAEEKEKNGQVQQQLAQKQQALRQQLEKEEQQSTQWKTAIDEYTKEIDRCIEWLTNNG
jgi:DNA anti-recombination protein RmuC